MKYTLDISLKYRRFYLFLANRISVGKIVSIPINIRYFGDISTDISNFLFFAWYNHNLFANTIIMVPSLNIYYTFIVVMRQEIVSYIFRTSGDITITY